MKDPGLYFRTFTRNTAEFRKKFPILFDFPCGDNFEKNEILLVMYDGDHPVVACDFTVEDVEIILGDVYHVIDIQLFEVSEDFQGQGYANKMLEYLYNKYNVSLVRLRHRYLDDDDGDSRSFWKYHGYRVINRQNREMEYRRVKK